MSFDGPPTPARRADIQGLRAVAVLIVVLHHAGAGFSGGFVGVDVFFVISGFVITQLLWREHASTGRVSLVDFYLRRVKRILPALAVMLIVVMLAAVWLTAYGAQSSTASTGIAAALFNANNYLAMYGIDGGYFALSSKSNPLLHTWSLSVEEQFYFLFPALLVLLFRLGRRGPAVGRQRPFFLGLGTVGLISFVASLAVRRGRLGVSDPTEVAFYLAPFRVWEFAAGALVAGLVTVRPRVFSGMRPLSSGVGVALVAAAALLYNEETVFPDVAVVLPVAGTAMLLIGGLRRSGNPVSAVLETRGMQWLGDVSYSWYLWHWPFVVFANAMWPEFGLSRPVAALASLLPAAASYYFVENPVRTRPFRRRTVAVIAVICVLGPIAAATGLNAGHRLIADSSAVQPFIDHLDTASGCDDPTPLDERPDDECVWRVPDAVGDVLLIGDSNAGHFTEAAQAAAEALHLDLRIATMSSCPFIELAVIERGRLNEECGSFVAGALRWIDQHSPTIVVVANASDIYVRNDVYDLAPGSADRVGSAGADVVPTTNKGALWASGFETTLADVLASESEVLVAHPVPKFPNYWLPRAMAPLRLLIDPTGSAPTTDRAGAEARRARALVAEVAAAEATGAATLDVFDQLCPEATCSAYSDGRWVYRDHNHITAAASLTLAPAFQQALSDLLTR